MPPRSRRCSSTRTRNRRSSSARRAASCYGAARGGIAVGEYAPTLVKKAVVGTGGAEKAQVHAMVSRLLPGAKIAGPDAADALAVAITHAHHLASARRIA